jgi:serpin B
MHRFIVLTLAFPLAALAAPADGLNAFAGDLYRQLAQTRGNLVISPLSVSTALAMTLAGARGQTATEMNTVLRNPPDAALLEQLTKAGNNGGDQLLLAQSLWVDRGFAILPDFIRTSEQQFHATPQAAGFSHHPDDARSLINRWVNEKTKGKIADLFAPGALTRDTRLVLASAVYFNGKWQSKFDPTATKPGDFHTTSTAAVQTQFMHQTSRFPYAETATAQILELPYGGGSLAFDVILPKPGTPLTTLEDALRSDGFSAWIGNLQRKQVEVALPKFRAESAFSLKTALSAMGMPSAFTNAADFSGIDGRRDLTISQVAHKAFIDVSEEGTEAAAATGVAVSLTAFAQPVAFHADHPFLFFIRDTRNGAILFAGRLEQPTQ